MLISFSYLLISGALLYLLLKPESTSRNAEIQTEFKEEMPVVHISSIKSAGKGNE